MILYSGSTAGQTVVSARNLVMRSQWLPKDLPNRGL